IEHEVPTEEILNQLTDVIDLIAKNIAENVIEKNGNAPSAVFLTGGGSKIPRLNQFIAKYFDLPIERVSTRNMANIPNLHVKNFSLAGPEVITPIGILAKAISHFGRDFVEVYVNGTNVRLFNTKTLMVVDALILVGFNPHDLIAKAAKSFTVKVNGQMKKLFGESEEHGVIYVNDKPASISTPIKAQDQIVMVPAKNGKEPDLMISQVIPMQTKFMLNGEHERTITNICVNGESVESDVRLKDQDIIEFDQITTVKDLLKQFANQTPFNVIVNGFDVDDSYVITDLDFIEIPAWNSDQPEVVEVMSDLEINVVESHNMVDCDFVETSGKNDERLNSDGIITETLVEEIGFNGAEDIKEQKIFSEEEPLFIIEGDTSIEILYNGTSLKLPGDMPLVFVNLFDYIDFDRTQPQGNLHMTKNGNSVNYFDPIQDGDKIEIKWI
ncbi:MAG: actin-like ATPase involved in cell division, partial [Bacillales bacterium]|nr:actin-like ATPase involved in cell division [Bacillales bacterium]